MKLLGEKVQSAILAILLLTVGVLSWQLQLRAPFEVDPSDLANLPLEIDRWRGAELEVATDVAEMLDADFHVQRIYAHPLVGVVWLYVGYYGTERGGRPEHTPWVCYPSNGWSIVRSEVIDVPNVAVGRVNELLVERDGERRLVHFWYQSNRRAGMIGEFDQAVDRLISRLETGRADGSLVRLSMPLSGPADESTARLQLIAFGREIAPFLRTHWPSETKPS